MTDLKVSLEAMLRRASRVAEQMFAAQGNVDTFWLVEPWSERALVTVRGPAQNRWLPSQYFVGCNLSKARHESTGGLYLTRQNQQDFRSVQCLLMGHPPPVTEDHEN